MAWAIAILTATVMGGGTCPAQEKGAPAAVASTESTVQTAKAAPQSAEILARCQAALAEAGTYRAELKLEAWYPTRYTSEISVIASPSGDERAEIKTTMRADSFKSLEVVAGGILWNEQSTPQGKVVLKTDINEIRKALAAEKAEFAPLPAQGAGAMFDLAGLVSLVDFTQAGETSLGERQVFALTGGLAAKFAEGKARLPAAAAKFYKAAAVYVDRNDFLPVRIELGSENGKPLVRLDFLKIEKNVTVPEGAFSYEVPADAELVDLTASALSELTIK
jgi:hypothetical protein